MLDPKLLQLWRDINARGFQGSLAPPQGLGWLTQAEREALGGDLWGVATPMGLIGIDDRLRPSSLPAEYFNDPSKEAEVDREAAKLTAATMVLIHEMVHQALHQADVRHDHDAAFVSRALAVHGCLSEIRCYPLPNESNAAFWPCPVDVFKYRIGLS